MEEERINIEQTQTEVHKEVLHKVIILEIVTVEKLGHENKTNSLFDSLYKMLSMGEAIGKIILLIEKILGILAS